MTGKKTPKNGSTKVKQTKTSNDFQDDESSKPANNTFPIIGIGASAGGLEALKSFFSKVPKNSGMAYIVVVHLSPKQPSMMPELLQKVSSIPVIIAKDGKTVESNNVYVIPPDKEINIFKGKLQLLDVVDRKIFHPVDSLFKSLALDQDHFACGIVLSGTGTDGTLGVKEIKANGGLILAQSETSASYDGMPRSAVNTGQIDFILPPEEMPSTIINYFQHPQTIYNQHTTTTTKEHEKCLSKIFNILRTRVGHDFSLYKVNTLLRRISRRMGLNQIDSHELYVRFLRGNPNEVDALFRELLIGVTSFFRDPESFAIIKNDLLPPILDQMTDDSTFRVWIPGCSTGEEAYSLAIILRECLDKISKRIHLQLFGTDIDSHAIDKAREGIFPESIRSDVNQERIKRFFIKEDNHYRVHKEIRDCVVFSVQDIIKDPPFSRLNLLCCRNLMIYLDTEAQKKLLPLFHYTLQPESTLVLGSSETIGGFTNLFEVVNNKWKIFKRREIPQQLRQHIDFPSGLTQVENDVSLSPAATNTPKSKIDLITQKAILDQFGPTAILVDGRGDIQHFQGRSGLYLEPPTSGAPTNNILDLAREGLRIELSSALRSAKASNQKITRKRVNVKTNGDFQLIDLHVSPQHSPKELSGLFLVVFEKIDVDIQSPDSKQSEQVGLEIETNKIRELEKELQITRESHQTTIEELELSNEELKSTNEEMQSSNEELQSTNEELESSKEELQSLNEELQTVNAELQSKVDELSAAQDDMRNLLNSTEIATIFVDNDMHIRRFTPQATHIVNLIQNDIGRPLQHVVNNLANDGMIKDLSDVLSKLSPKETEVETTKGDWFNMRIIPYRTTDNRIDGAVLTFSKISEQKFTHKELKISILEKEQAFDLIESIFNMNADPILVIDSRGKIVIANESLASLMEDKLENVTGIDILNSSDSIFYQKSIKKELQSSLQKGKDFEIDNLEIKTSTDTQNYKVHGRIIKKSNEFPYRLYLQFRKVPTNG